MAIDKTRIMAIGGIAFFTSLIGIVTTDAVFGMTLSLWQLLLGAFIIAFINAGLAICQEIKVETDKPCEDGKNCLKQAKTTMRKRNLMFLM